MKLTDWKPECPECGVNLNYCKANEILLQESEKAEAEHAKFQPKIDRAKAAYAGSKLAVLRIVFTLLPVGALFLPLCKDINAVWIYKLFSEQVDDVGLLIKNTPLLALSVLLLLISAAMVLVCLIFIITSLGRHGKGRTIALYAVMPVCAALSAAMYSVFQRQFDTQPLSYGAFIYIALQAFSFLWNLFVCKKGIPVKYTQCYIGGLPSEEYFGYKESGMSDSELRRKMLVALTRLQAKAEGLLDETGEEAAV